MKKKAPIIINQWQNPKLDKLIQTLRRRNACKIWSIPINENSMLTIYWETLIEMKEDIR